MTCRLPLQERDCVECAEGTFSTIGGATEAATCESCLAGKYGASQGSDAESDCVPCGKGKYSSTTGATSEGTCQSCMAGKYLETDRNSASSDCLSCDVGKFLLTEGGTYEGLCMECEVGKFLSTDSGSLECSLCPAGSHTDGKLLKEICQLSTGRAEKQECVPGIWTKTVCPDGYEISTLKTGREPFVRCEEMELAACDAGLYGQCVACGFGRYLNRVTSTTSCVSCSAHSTTILSNSTRAIDCICDEGYFMEGGETHQNVSCAPCSNGTYSSRAASACTSCPANTFSPEASKDQVACVCNLGYVGPDGGACSACSPGTFKDSIGTATPIQCKQGTYSNISGMSFCYFCAPFSNGPLRSDSIANCKCFPGYTGEDGGPCTACKEGSYKNTTGSGSCNFCAEGRYLDLLAGTVCLDCPVNTWSMHGQDHIRNCSCIRGYEGPDGLAECVKCGPGKYKDSFGTFKCFQCPSGTYSEQTGNYDLSLCLACPQLMSSMEGSLTIMSCICEEGYTGENGDECSACVPGKYKARKGSSRCVLCPLGTYNDVSAAASDNTCLSCVAGKYSDTMGATSDACIECVSGKHSEILGSTTEFNCALCLAGKYSDMIGGNSSSTCRLCSRGKYSDNDGAPDCVACLQGKYGSSEGAKSPDLCIDCPVGKYGDQHAASSVAFCSSCPAGKFSAETGVTLESVCKICGSNFYSKIASTACSLCPVNSASSPQTPSAANCTCFDGFVQNSPGDNCFNPSSACPAGIYQMGQTEDNFNQCVSCPSGKSSNKEGAKTDEICQACELGKCSAAVGASTCNECPAGASGPTEEMTECLICDTGKFSNTTALTACFDCETGSYNPVQASSTCLLCNAGSFGIARGSSTQDVCVECAAGTSSQLRGQFDPWTCKICAQGSYSDDGATACLHCPPKTISHLQSSSRYDCVCAAGFAGPDGGACLECLPGFYKARNGTSECVACQPGKYSDSMAAATGCIACPRGTNSPLLSARLLDCTCNRGFKGNADGMPCERCSTGKYKVPTGSANCSVCGRGWYNPDMAAIDATFCVACLPGKYGMTQAAAHSTECIQCEAGSYAANSGTSECDKCEAGKHMSVTGSWDETDCKVCPTGTFSKAGSSVCEICPAGKYALVASPECIDCPIDTYSSMSRSSFCPNCTLEYCEIGKYRPRCKKGSKQDSSCAKCTFTMDHTMFVDHGEYNDTCTFVCELPYVSTFVFQKWYLLILEWIPSQFRTRQISRLSFLKRHRISGSLCATVLTMNIKKNRKRTAQPVYVSAVILAQFLSEGTLELIRIILTRMVNGYGHVEVVLKVASVMEQRVSCATSSGTR